MARRAATVRLEFFNGTLLAVEEVVLHRRRLECRRGLGDGKPVHVAQQQRGGLLWRQVAKRAGKADRQVLTGDGRHHGASPKCQ